MQRFVRNTKHISILQLFTRFNHSKRIAVGISGGIDSAVTAKLMKEKGYSVFGIHMQNWDLSSDETLHKGETNCFEKDENDAKLVCDILDIPFYRVSFSKEYWNNIWETVIHEYENGFTPNPDILCNKYIKAGSLLQYVKKEFDINKVATGHYARKKEIQLEDGSIEYKLLSGIDKYKDQAYFLSQVSQKQLSSLEFPLGEYTKEQVKTIAKSSKLKFLLEKKESMGVCFVGKRKNGFEKFISQYITPKKGNVIFNNQVIGTHDGLHTKTIGQKAKIGGCSEKLYCIDKNYSKNQIIVGVKSDLTSKVAFVSNINWISGKIPSLLVEKESISVSIQLHNLGSLISAKLSIVKSILYNVTETTMIKVQYDKSINEIVAPGQYIAFFKHDECLGSGKVI